MKSSAPCCYLPRRYLVAFLGLGGFTQLYLLRVNLSFAVVAMTSNHTNETEEFQWNSKEKGLILGAYFYGYITTQILGGFLAPIIGAAKLYCISILVSSILSLLTPVTAIYGGMIPLVVLRIIQGIFQGVQVPSSSELWSHWAPPMERTKLLSIGNNGIYVGTLLAMGSCGAIAEYLGWTWMFYIFGMTGIIWCVLWTWLIYEDPTIDPNITQEEKEYITSSIGQINRVKFTEAPWKSILTSPSIWAAIISLTTETTVNYTLITQLPSFLKDVAGWSLDKLGFLTAVPYFTLAIVTPCAGILADVLRERFKISTNLVRKIYNCGNCMVKMCFLIIMTQVTDSPTLILVCLTFVISFGGFASYGVNILDLCPQYAGLVIGFANTFGTLPGMISPIITGYIVQNKLTSEWLTVFYITSGVCLFGAIFYAIFGSGERQPWAQSKTRAEDVDKEIGEEIIKINQ